MLWFSVLPSSSVEWVSEGSINEVLVEFSCDDGATWYGVFPANEGDAGQYEWMVPAVDSEQCLVRVSSATLPAVYDTSDAAFTIVPVE